MNARDPGADSDTVLEVVHETAYAYSASVSLAHHRAHLQPLHAIGQAVLDSQIDIDPTPSHRRDAVDAFGNACSHFELTLPHQALRVRAVSRVRLSPRFADLCPPASPPWEDVAERLRYVVGRPFDAATEFVAPSPFVPQLPALAAWARPSFRPRRPLAEVALELMHRVHTEFVYESRSTEIDTPLHEVLDARRGVCQDFAHLLIGAWRLHGLAARYVSGYLLTQVPDGSAPLVGADASHAWVQVWCPDTPGVGPDGWLDLDPTNDRVPDIAHVRLAVGRDFGDVTPLRGVIQGGGRHTLTVGVTTRQLGTPAR